MFVSYIQRTSSVVVKNLIRIADWDFTFNGHLFCQMIRGRGRQGGVDMASMSFGQAWRH